MNIKALIALLGFIGLSQAGYAACITTALETAPEERFFSVRSTVSDIATGLEWSRCSLGQSYENDRCVNAPESFATLDAALLGVAEANAQRLHSHDDWRLPNIKELYSLVEFACHSPSINTTVWPDTPPSTFLTSTPNITFTDVLIVDFRFGTQLTESFNTDRFIRLVREK